MTMQSVYNDEGPLTYLAGEDLEAYRRVKIKSGTTTTPPEIEYAGAGEACIGVTLRSAADGGLALVKGLNEGGSFLVCASGAITEGATLYGTASGKVDDSGTGTPQFTALMASTGTGHVITCIVQPYYSTTAATVSIADAGNFTSQTTVEGALQEVYQHVETIQALLPIPLTSFTKLDGTPLAKFADSTATATAGINLANSKALCLRWNNNANPCAIATAIPIPPDLDGTANAVVHIAASKSGATLGDAVTFTVGAFNAMVGATHDADTDFGSASTAMTGNAAAKTVAELTCTLAAANVDEAPGTISLTVGPTAGTLGTDDVMVHGVWLEYKRKVLTS